VRASTTHASGGRGRRSPADRAIQAQAKAAQEGDGLTRTFRAKVLIVAPSLEQAEAVLAKRLRRDEDYGFNYLIKVDGNVEELVYGRDRA
jgi:hypothetical protein